MVWAIVKGQVGRQYTQDTKFKDVHVRLTQAFAELAAYSIKGCIHKADRQLNKLAEYIMEQQEVDASDSDDDNSNDGNDSNSDSSSSESDSSESEKYIFSLFLLAASK
ncbi:hypothetical protein H257_11381 [Aphanomyces astaci]|uniref:Uncharacterized protein n=1 Tax=Aphanomyces astaci TaxID=112090 RepID=W4G325_APHAT|nr:hypothetical protein H257_11381 [Aphanomyces astaci]ETV74070.1 hypothetical protein H257_11381 [Aphanomyces astaci]|eukprot:XP_009836583.1 hypothetical protein H257_11381 [Aphanomyces astaci]